MYLLRAGFATTRLSSLREILPVDCVFSAPGIEGLSALRPSGLHSADLLWARF